MLDISIKLYKNIDPDNVLKYKNLALLGGLMDASGQNNMMQNIYKAIFKGLEKFEPE